MPVRTCREIRRHIVEFEQPSQDRATYGPRLVSKLAKPLTAGFGRGVDASNLRHMRLFYLAFPIRDALRHELSWTRYRMVDDPKRAPDDNPTADIILCAGKDTSVVRYSVPHENEQLFAGKYKLILPPEDDTSAASPGTMRPSPSSGPSTARPRCPPKTGGIIPFAEAEHFA